MNARKTFSASIFTILVITWMALTALAHSQTVVRQDSIPPVTSANANDDAGIFTTMVNWIEAHPAATGLIGAVIGVMVTLLIVLLTHETKKRAAAKTRATTKADLKTRQEIDHEEQQAVAETVEQRYLAWVRNEHGHIRLYGFLSGANIDVRLLDVFVSLRFSESWTGRQAEPRQPELIEAERKLSPQEVLKRALSRHKALLILGGAGSGKTTLMKYFAICCLDAENRHGIGLGQPLLPILVPLRQIDSGKPFAHALSDWASSHNQAVSPKQFEDWLHRPGALVLLDGLDEISDLATRRQVCQWIDQAVPAFGASTFIVTCRFTGYREAEGVQLLVPHVSARVLDLDAEQQRIFLQQWFRAALYERLEQHESKNAARLAEIDRESADEAETVMRFLSQEENQSLRDMATVPVLLQIMAIIHKEQGSLSGERTELYSRSMDYLLDHRDQTKKIQPLMSASKARLVLRPLALWMQAKGKDEAPRPQIEAQIRRPLQEVRPGTEPAVFLGNIRDRAGVLVGAGADTFTFQHKSFREFLAASEIANRKEVRLLVRHFDQDWWRETLLFSAGMSSPVIFTDFLLAFLKSDKNAGPTAPLLLQMVREAALKPLAPFEAILADQRLAWQKRYNALQCLRLLRSTDAIKLVQTARQDKTEKVQQLAEHILVEWQVVQPTTSVRARIGVTYHPFEDNAEYLLVPGGKFSFSVTSQTCSMPALYFAKYPLTNKLYRRFISYLEGNLTELERPLPREKFCADLIAKARSIPGFAQYLSKDFREWRALLRSTQDDDKQFNGDDQPVVGVSWYAATAYCHWLNALQQAQMQSPVKDDNPAPVFRLPSEAEWEWAAGGGKRRYPWGDTEPTPDRANYGMKVGHTTPVGSYPAGATPEGLMDMAGNVWEWCEDWYDEKKIARVVRGGSFYGYPADLQCSVRNNGQPHGRSDGFGFRVVWRAQS